MSHKEIYEERISLNWSDDSIRLILTPSTLTKSVYFYIQEAGYFKTDDSYFTERKNLNSFLLVYTLHGKGSLKYQGETYTLEAGQCFYINCMKHHLYETVKHNHWEFLWIHFNGPNSLGYYEEFVRNEFRIITIEDPGFMENTMRQILLINQKHNAATEVITNCLITNLLTKLLVQTISSGTCSFQTPDYIKKVMKDIDQRFYTSLSLDQLAKDHGVSKFHLSREFKKYAGTTVNEYLIKNRISYAKELLKYSNLSVSEIACRCGVNNVSHFINLFKAREGTTPLTYRSEWGSSDR